MELKSKLMKVNLEKENITEVIKLRDSGFLEVGKNMTKLKYLWYPFTIVSNQFCYQSYRNG